MFLNCLVEIWSYTISFYLLRLPSFQGLRSSCSDCFIQPPVHCCTVGSRAFSVAGHQVWNGLPPEVTLAPSLATFRTRLQTFRFSESYPEIQLMGHVCVYTLAIVDLAMYLGHFKNSWLIDWRQIIHTEGWLLSESDSGVWSPLPDCLHIAVPCSD